MNETKIETKASGPSRLLVDRWLGSRISIEIGVVGGSHGCVELGYARVERSVSGP